MEKILFRDVVKSAVEYLGEYGFNLFDEYSDYDEDEINETIDDTINNKFSNIDKKNIVVRVEKNYGRSCIVITLADFDTYSAAIKEVFDLSGMLGMGIRKDKEQEFLNEEKLKKESNWDENFQKLLSIKDEAEIIWSKLNKEFQFDRNDNGFRNGWTFGRCIGNPEMNKLCEIDEYFELQKFSDLSSIFDSETTPFIIENTFPLIGEFESSLKEIKQFKFTKEMFSDFNKSFPLKVDKNEMEDER